MSHKMTIDVQDGDDVVVKEFVEEVRKLAGLIIELGHVWAAARRLMSCGRCSSSPHRPRHDSS
jgi:hypothetical protein